MREGLRHGAVWHLKGHQAIRQLIKGLQKSGEARVGGVALTFWYCVQSQPAGPVNRTEQECNYTSRACAQTRPCAQTVHHHPQPSSLPSAPHHDHQTRTPTHTPTQQSA